MKQRILSLQSSYGFDAGQNTVFQHIGNEVIMYVQGFNVIFYNYVRRQTVQTLNVGENVLKITHLEAYGPGASQLLICEERPEGAFVSLYSATSGAPAGSGDASGVNQGATVPKYALLHRLQIIAQISGERKEIRTVLFARMISATKLIVVTGAPDFAFLVYENDQKTASMPTYSLRVVQERVLDAAPETLKLLQLGERDFLLVAGATLKTVKLTTSPKFLPPNNIGSLSQKYYYTDAYFVNKHLRAKYPGIPVEGDQFVVLTTREGPLVFMYRTHILKELRLGFIDQVTSVRFLSDAMAGPSDVPGRKVVQNNPVSQEEQQQRNYQFFNNTYASIADAGLNQELAAGYFIVAGRSALHFLALRASELFRFIAKHGYFPTSNWEKQLNCENLIQHLMSYSVSTAADILYNKINGQFSISQIELNKSQSSLVFHGLNETFKLIGALKLNVVFKRLNELDRQLLFCKQNGQDFRRQVEQQLLSTDSEEIKRLIAQDQFTVLKGEIIDLNKQQTGFNGNFDQLNIGGVETTDWDANREITIFFDLVSNAQVASVCTTPGSDRITIYSKERQVRQFRVPDFSLINQAKFPEVARFLVQHASKDYVLLVGPDFVDKYLMQNGNLVKQFRFRVNYCSQLIVSQSGDVFLAVSGQNLNIYDFYNHKLLYIATMPSKILGVCRFYQDYNQIQTAGLYFVYTQDGQITLFDASANSVVKQTQIGGGCYIKAATTISSQFAPILCKSDSGSASPKTLLLCVLSDNTFVAFDEHLTNVTQQKFNAASQAFRMTTNGEGNLLAQEQKIPALKLQHLATQSSNEVICAINDGQMETSQLMLGHMTAIAVAQQYVAIGYSLGYVRVADLATGQSQLIAAQQNSVFALLPSQAGDGFVMASETGALQFYALAAREVENVYPVAVNSTVQVPAAYYKQLLEALCTLKQQIHGVRFHTAEQKRFLKNQFQTDQEILSQRALETISALQSHQAKLKTDHENAVILLKRQIANNEKLFEQSQKALNQQYAKRSIFMKDELEKLRVRKMEVENHLAVQKQLLIQENQASLEALRAQKKEEIEAVAAQLSALEAQNSADEAQALRFYAAAEADGYAELRSAETAFRALKEMKETEIEQARALLKQTKLQYDELEDQLTKQQQLNTVKQQEIRELGGEVGNIKKDIQLDKEEIQQHDITINQREQRIQELEQKIRELNKIQFILQFKIRELKRTIAPKEAQLADLRAKIEEMNKELLGYRLSLAALQNNRKDIGNKIRSLKVQIGDQDAERATYQSKLSEARAHVNGIVALIAKQEREHEAELAAQAKFASLPPLGGRRPVSGNTKAEIQSSGQSNGKLLPASGFCDRNIQFRRLVGALRALQDCLVNKPNPVKQLRKKQEEAGDFAKLESNVVKLQQKVARSRVQSKSSTGGVMAQNAALLQEINQLRRELHQAMVQANASCHIDNSLIKEYEQNAARIQQLRNEIKARQRQAQTAGFLPELQ